MALTESREEERELKQRFLREGIKTAAVDYGGDFISSVNKIIERAVVASKREDVIREVHADEGAVAGATRKLFRKLCRKPWVSTWGEKSALPEKRITSAWPFTSEWDFYTWTKLLWGWDTGLCIPKAINPLSIINNRIKRL